MDHNHLIDDLKHPVAYPWRPPTIELIETHVSWVFLAGDRVVKIKRPVDYGFVDHTTLERRHCSCDDEVRLNRRLTTDVYLGVVPITRDGAGHHVAGEGAPVEWATLMRRLPADGMLDVLLAAGAAPDDLADRLAARLIPFHRDAAQPCGTTAETAAAATAVVTENLDQLEPFAGAPLAPRQFALVRDGMRRFAAEQDDLLRARAADGWVKEGHGDLRCEHVCLEPEGTVQIYDCVEFSRAIRCADVASDLGFLLLDLDRFGANTVSRALLSRYRVAGFDLPDELVRFYKAHRALVRAKVACLDLSALAAPQREALTAKAVDYLNLATAAALPARPVLIAMTGLSGTGKSTVAAALGRALDTPVHSSDTVRKELTGRATTEPAAAAWHQGIYAPDQTARTYDRLMTLAALDLDAGQPTVVDASFLDPAQRARLAAVAAGANAPLMLVETVCDEAVTLRRIRERAARGGSPSDATEEIYRRQHETFAAVPPGIPSGARHVVIDTSSDGPASLDPALLALVDAGAIGASPADGTRILAR